MDKYLNLLKKTDYARVLVLLLVAKALIFDISYATFLISIPVLGFEAYKLYLKSKTPDPVRIDAAIRNELDNIKAKLTAESLQKSVKAEPRRYF
jgi:hypothetical protein